MIGSLRSALLGLACMAALAGCADRAPPPPPPAAVAPPPTGPVAVDGFYVGTRQLVRGGDGPGVLCGSLDPFTVTVSGRTFRYVLRQPEVPYTPTRTFAVTIDQDGAFRAVDGPAYIVGSAGGDAMQGEISGDACGYVFQADRRTQ
jgi:hypothetical protein